MYFDLYGYLYMLVLPEGEFFAGPSLNVKTDLGQLCRVFDRITVQAPHLGIKWFAALHIIREYRTNKAFILALIQYGCAKFLARPHVFECAVKCVTNPAMAT